MFKIRLVLTNDNVIDLTDNVDNVTEAVYLWNESSRGGRFIGHGKVDGAGPAFLAVPVTSVVYMAAIEVTE